MFRETERWELSMELDAIRQRPNALAPFYARFRVAERLRLTGHSHQAWPDCGFEAQRQAWLDAAELADDKWDRAFEKADRVRAGYARLLGEDSGGARGYVVLGGSTHELFVRLLSAMPLRERPRFVTTDGEFHTVRRQLDRLIEEGLEVVRVPVEPHASIAERLCAAVDERTSLAVVSSVLYTTGRIVSDLDAVAAACTRVGAELLVDAYHHLNVIPFSVRGLGLEDAFVVGGGYKYCQLGEGNAFLRCPAGNRLRPAVTGWYAEFASLGQGTPAGEVGYGSGQERWAGATYDPVSHYRAAEVFEHHARLGLTPEFLREVSQAQVGLLAREFDALDLDPIVIRRPEIPLDELGGFLVLVAARARELCRSLGARGVVGDSRGEHLRLGPAPYLDDEQLRTAMAALGEVVREERRGPRCS